MTDIKIKRISSMIMREISNILANEAKDEFLKTITITGIDLANDLSYAKVYFTSILDIAKNTLEKEANEAAGYIRHELAERVELRHTPELKFVFDESIDYGNRIEEIIKEIHDEK